MHSWDRNWAWFQVQSCEMASLPVRRQGKGRGRGGGAKGSRHLLNYICICSCSNRLNFVSACSYLSGDLEQLLSTHVAGPYKSGGKISPWASTHPDCPSLQKASNWLYLDIEKWELCAISKGEYLQLSVQGYILQN